jgi:hypothetical protein
MLILTCRGSPTSGISDEDIVGEAAADREEVSSSVRCWGQALIIKY